MYVAYSLIPVVGLDSKDRKNRETSLGRAGRRQTVYNIIHKLHQLKVASLEEEAVSEHIEKSELKGLLQDLRQRGLIYSPKPGFVVCVDE